MGGSSRIIGCELDKILGLQGIPERREIRI